MKGRNQIVYKTIAKKSANISETAWIFNVYNKFCMFLKVQAKLYVAVKSRTVLTPFTIVFKF